MEAIWTENQIKHFLQKYALKLPFWLSFRGCCNWSKQGRESGQSEGSM